MQTGMRVGQAARREVAVMQEAISLADETTGSISLTKKLRLNKKDELKAAGITTYIKCSTMPTECQRC